MSKTYLEKVSQIVLSAYVTFWWHSMDSKTSAGVRLSRETAISCFSHFYSCRSCPVSKLFGPLVFCTFYTHHPQFLHALSSVQKGQILLAIPSFRVRSLLIALFSMQRARDECLSVLTVPTPWFCHIFFLYCLHHNNPDLAVAEWMHFFTWGDKDPLLVQCRFQVRAISGIQYRLGKDWLNVEWRKTTSYSLDYRLI